MKDKSKKSTYSTTFGIDPVYTPFSDAMYFQLYTIKKPILKIGSF